MVTDACPQPPLTDFICIDALGATAHSSAPDIQYFNHLPIRDTLWAVTLTLNKLYSTTLTKCVDAWMYMSTLPLKLAMKN